MFLSSAVVLTTVFATGAGGASGAEASSPCDRLSEVAAGFGFSVRVHGPCMLPDTRFDELGDEKRLVDWLDSALYGVNTVLQTDHAQRLISVHFLASDPVELSQAGNSASVPTPETHEDGPRQPAGVLDQAEWDAAVELFAQASSEEVDMGGVTGEKAAYLVSGQEFSDAVDQYADFRNDGGDLLLAPVASPELALQWLDEGAYADAKVAYYERSDDSAYGYHDFDEIPDRRFDKDLVRVPTNAHGDPTGAWDARSQTSPDLEWVMFEEDLERAKQIFLEDN